MSGYGRGMPNNISQGQQANYSQYSNQQQPQQLNVGRPSPGFAPTSGSGQRDEWDSFFSQETNKGVAGGNSYPQSAPQQQQAAVIGQSAGNVFQQRQQPQAGGTNQPTNISNPIDRANQLLRNLHQSSDINVAPAGGTYGLSRGPVTTTDTFTTSQFNQPGGQQQMHVQAGYDQQLQRRGGPVGIQTISAAPQQQQQQQQIRQQQQLQQPDRYGPATTAVANSSRGEVVSGYGHMGGQQQQQFSQQSVQQQQPVQQQQQLQPVQQQQLQPVQQQQLQPVQQQQQPVQQQYIYTSQQQGDYSSSTLDHRDGRNVRNMNVPMAASGGGGSVLVVPAEYGVPPQQQLQGQVQAPQYVIQQQQQQQPMRSGQIPVQQGVQYAAVPVEQFQQQPQQQQQGYSAYSPQQQQQQHGSGGNVNMTSSSYQAAGTPVILTSSTSTPTSHDVSRYGLNVNIAPVAQQQLQQLAYPQQQQSYMPVQQQQQPSQQQKQIQIQNVLQNLPPPNIRPGARTSRFSGGQQQQQQSSEINTVGGRGSTQFSPTSSGGKRPFQSQQQGGTGSGGFQNKYSRVDGNSSTTLNRSSNFNSNARTGANTGSSSSSNFQQRNDSGNKRTNYNTSASVSVTNKQQQSSGGSGYGHTGRDRSSERSGGGSSSRIQKRVQPPSGGVSATSDRRRSRSPSKERRRERAPTGGTSGGGGSGKSHDTSITSVAASHAYGSRRIDYAKLVFPNLIDFYNAPIISRHAHALSAPDLFSRFPKLYVPADFVRIEMDWNALTDALQSDLVHHVYVTANTEITMQPGVVEEGTAAAAMLLSATTEPPRFTNATPSDDQTSSMFSCCSRVVFTAPKPVKFNARVLITFGMNNSETERIDFTLSKKLRVLIGRRKQNVMLLGGSWSRELDGGDPLTDRSCLIHTARRCVLAQAMVDINMCTRYVKMCEIIYQRPKEEIKGKLYPEQEEITVVYLCSVQPSLDMSEEEFSALWGHYIARVDGKEVGPIVNCDANTSATALLTPIPLVEQIAVEDVNNETKVDDITHAQQQSVIEDKPSVDDAMDNTSATGEITSLAVADDSAEPLLVTEGQDAEETTADMAISMTASDPSSSSSSSTMSDTAIDISTTSETHADIVEPVGEGNIAMSEGEATLEDKDSSTTTTTINAVSNGNHPIPKRERSQSNATIPAVPTSSTSSILSTHSVFTKTHLIKPSKPCTLICPMPISKEVASDFSRKQEGVSVKLFTLGQLLTYSEDDSNERIFEASVAGEILRSLIAIDYADFVTDFVMAEYSSPSYSYNGDPRIFSAVKSLRRLSKQASATASMANAKAIEHKESVVSVSENKISDDSTKVMTESKISNDDDVEMEVSGGDGHIDVIESKSSIENEIENQSRSSSTSSDVVDSEITPATTKPMDGMDDAATGVGVDSETSPAESTNVEIQVDTADVDAEAVSVSGVDGGQTIDEHVHGSHGDDIVDDEDQHLMSESDAKEWRRCFLNACRWFDTDQQRSLRHDHLELIIYSSTRDISRAELSAAAWSVCKDERLRYEIHF